MGSTLSVSELKGLTSGSNANQINVPAGQTLYAPGHVIQFKKTSYITGAQSTTSATFADITGASLSITPSSTSSIIMIGWTGHLGGSGAFRYLRDSTAINTLSNNYYYYDTDTFNQTNWAANSTRTSFKEEVFDEPSTTSSVTYKVQFAAYTGVTNNGFGINESNVRREGSILYLMEIAQ